MTSLSCSPFGAQVERPYFQCVAMLTPVEKVPAATLAVRVTQDSYTYIYIHIYLDFSLGK